MCINRENQNGSKHLFMTLYNTKHQITWNDTHSRLHEKICAQTMAQNIQMSQQLFIFIISIGRKNPFLNGKEPLKGSKCLFESLWFLKEPSPFQRTFEEPSFCSVYAVHLTSESVDILFSLILVFFLSVTKHGGQLEQQRQGQLYIPVPYQYIKKKLPKFLFILQ